MTPSLSPDLQAVLELTRQGYTEVQIGQQLGIPAGTVKSRRATLRTRGQLAKLPRGGNTRDRSRRGTMAQTGYAPVAVQTLESRLDRLEAQLGEVSQQLHALVQCIQQPGTVHETVHTMEPLPRGPSSRWNLYMLRPVREAVEALAAARGMPPSQVVQELVWIGLHAHTSSALEGVDAPTASGNA